MNHLIFNAEPQFPSAFYTLKRATVRHAVKNRTPH